MIGQDIIVDTPIELYKIGGHEVWVKREDLCIQEAKFSKLRGVYSHLSKVPQKYIGILDSYHSKAGWGVSYICKELGKQAILFYPEYKYEPGYRDSQKNALRLGAELKPLQAGMQAVLFNTAKKQLREIYGSDAYMMPNALKLIESVDETANQVSLTTGELFEDTTWVISISSGTIAAGVIKGLLEHKANVKVILHMGYSRSIDAVLKYLMKYVPNLHEIELIFVDEGYSYKQHVDGVAPFPCNKYYDLKAWKWLEANIESIETEKIMFWNIGE